MSRTCLGVLVVGFLVVGLVGESVDAAVETHIESFDVGNPAGWQISSQSFLEPAGGNPDAFLHVPSWSTPKPSTWNDAGVVSAFSGDYRERGVISVGVDWNVFLKSLPAMPTFPLTVLLSNGVETPAPGDDCWVYYTGEETTPSGLLPCFGGVNCQGWKSFEFEIPSQSETLPPGWQVIGSCPANPDDAWNLVIGNVTQLEFFFGDPTTPGIFFNWDLGVDNPRISWDATVEGDLDGDGSVGPFDLALLLGSWGPCADCGNCPADFNGDCTVGAADLAILLGNWG